MVGPTVRRMKRSIDNKKDYNVNTALLKDKMHWLKGKIVRFKKWRRYTSISIIASSGEQSIKKEHEIKKNKNKYILYI